MKGRFSQSVVKKHHMFSHSQLTLSLSECEFAYKNEFSFKGSFPVKNISQGLFLQHEHLLPAVAQRMWKENGMR